jgi:hypothetical protein
VREGHLYDAAMEALHATAHPRLHRPHANSRPALRGERAISGAVVSAISAVVVKCGYTAERRAPDANYQSPEPSTRALAVAGAGADHQWATLATASRGEPGARRPAFGLRLVARSFRFSTPVVPIPELSSVAKRSPAH